MMPTNPDTDKVNESLIKQNLCLLCYKDGKTLDELAELTGIPKPYLEFDLDWLVKREFLSLNGRNYSTSFPILYQKHFQNRGAIYQSTRKEYIDKIIEYLWDTVKNIKSINFYGSDFPTEKLMWSIIMMSWDDFYGICSDSCETNGKYDRYYWLGIYNFSWTEYHPEIVSSRNMDVKALLHRLYCSVTEPGFKADALGSAEKEKLAEAVSDGLIVKDGGSYRPDFVVMTSEQLLTLQRKVFAPLLELITPQMKKMSEIFSRMHKKEFPKCNHAYIAYHTYIDLWNFGIFTLMFAAEEGEILLPDSPEKGVPLTLVIIK